MKLLPYKLRRLERWKWIWVSQYPEMSKFAVPVITDTRLQMPEYYSFGQPGWGFFTHSGNSQSYRRYIEAYGARYRKSLRNLLFTPQPNYKSLIAEAEKAMNGTDDTMYKAMFEGARNMLMLAQRYDYLKPMADALRRKVHNHHHDSVDSYHLKEIRRQMRKMEERRDLLACDLARFYTDEQMEHYAEMSLAFYEVCKVHHIWDIMDENRASHSRTRVYFDLGTLNFIKAPFHIPMMKTMKGEKYFIFPDRVLHVRSPFDFDTVMLRDISIRFGSMGDGIQSELRLPELRLAFSFSSEKRVAAFVEAWRRLKEDFKS